MPATLVICSVLSHICLTGPPTVMCDYCCNDDRHDELICVYRGNVEYNREEWVG